MRAVFVFGTSRSRTNLSIARGSHVYQVLELPRTAGVRLGHSRIWIKDTPWTSVAQHILRVDLGLDVAAQHTTEDHRRIVHVIPRTGIEQCDLDSVSVETALAYDPFVDRDGGLRWSAGLTGMLKLGWLQPAAVARPRDGVPPFRWISAPCGSRDTPRASNSRRFALWRARRGTQRFGFGRAATSIRKKTTTGTTRPLATQYVPDTWAGCRISVMGWRPRREPLVTLSRMWRTLSPMRVMTGSTPFKIEQTRSFAS